jgi:hypothetical protein
LAVLPRHPPFHGDSHNIFGKAFDDFDHGLLLQIHIDSIALDRPASPSGLEGRMLWLLELDTKFADQILAEKPTVRDEARRVHRRRLATIEPLGCR